MNSHCHTAHVPWGTSDTGSWQDQVEHVESWLTQHVSTGSWSWSWYSLKQDQHCGVQFAHAQDLMLFLLRFSEGIAAGSISIRVNNTTSP
jgi:hypothetical protein